MTPKHISADERDRLLRQYSGIPTSVVWRYRRTIFACKMDYDDAQGYANLGLVRAANFFNPAVNQNFMTVAYICCCRALCREITRSFEYQNKNRSLESITERSVWWHNRKRTMRVTVSGFMKDLTGNPGFSKKLERRDATALNIEPKSREDTHLVDEADEFEAVVRFLNTRVPKAHREMAVLRFAHGMDMQAIGRVVGLSRERVRQITSAVKEKLIDWKRQQDEGVSDEGDHSQDGRNGHRRRHEDREGVVPAHLEQGCLHVDHRVQEDQGQGCQG